ncbi:ATP-dependent RNA helicase DEAH12, chloroplastic [Trichonephila clavata]|uniref:ATP-dependent RNA helicase DEAH12, chloroplastic n=1 Tax=Trichonephila clavata TaxID=2740835 RepID=A0A8X6LB33_TRICU|nr:ATP-dependent RNA helicase DEAH12, chloroplastic [Trichonephila clavata]
MKFFNIHYKEEENILVQGEVAFIASYPSENTMSSKDHGKKNPGQFFHGKPNQKGKGAKSSNTQDESKGNLPKQEKSKIQGQQRKKGNQDNKALNVMQQNAISQQGRNQIPLNMNTLLSGSSVAYQGTNFLNQLSSTTQITHISVNVHSSSISSVDNQGLPSSSQLHQMKDFPRKTNQGSHLPFQSKNSETPTQLRVYSKSQESSSSNTITNKPPQNFGRGQLNKKTYLGSQHSQNIGRGKLQKDIHIGSQPIHSTGRGEIHKQSNNGSQLLPNTGRGQFHKRSNIGSQFLLNSGRGQSHKQVNIGLHPLHNVGRGQLQKHINIGSQVSQNFGRGRFHKPRGFHHGPQNQSNLSRISNVKQQGHQSTNLSLKNQSYKIPINKKETSVPFFFKTHSNESNLGSVKNSASNNSSSNIPFQVNAQTKSTPIYKFSKSSNSPKENSVSSSSKENLNTKTKPLTGKKTRNRKKKQKSNLWKKKESNVEVVPLFSFQSTPVNPETKEKDPVDSDDASMSRCSSEESIWTTNISDDGTDSFSDESEVISEVSAISSMKDSEYSLDIDSGISSKQSGIVSVFWDIENCPVPREKSAVDFVKLVRTKLYEGRTEGNFSVVCDVHNLNNIHAEELHASNVTVFHMSSTNKNAADTKLNSLLLEFRDQYKEQTGCAIVLISGDSDFANVLNTLRFKHNIYIDLICKNNARHSLIEAAHKCIFYEDFVKTLPARSKIDDTEYLIIVSNFAKSLTPKQVKSSLSLKLKSVNCRIKMVNKTSAEITLPDECARERALFLLKGHEIGGNVVQTTCSERRKTVVSPKTMKKIKVKSEKIEHAEIKNELVEKEQVLNKSPEESTSNCKGATLCIYVGTHMGDTLHWKKELENLWDMSDFTLQWEGKFNEGYFLANFKSLKKAQKVKKILQKSQTNEPTSPKFLKLIKQDGILGDLNLGDSIMDSNMKKIQERIQIIESKKENCLNKHKQSIVNQKDLVKSSIPGANDALSAKLAELNEQKVTFLNYTQDAINKVRSIDMASEIIDETLNNILHDFTRECNCLTSALPIYAKKNIILKKVKKNQVLIIRAETGSGKSTQLTQYIWREQTTCKRGLIICTQPRKIAAISLAKHVSTQIGCALGDIVGYQVGTSIKRSLNTAILYVTDFTMLKMMVNNDLHDVSCIIVDEAHERSVYTDLLLGMIKNCLKTRPELKLIITSATIDTTIFKNYFVINDDSILEVSGRTFPIEDIWLDYDVALGWDYFKNAINTVCNILEQELADILVFLTTPFETEKAVKVLTEKLDTKFTQSVKIFQLHGKLDVLEQQKIFDRLPKNTCKVVFSTNCAETSVTIPGIKYVVDCGLVKESHYDSIRNMSIMSVSFISQSSAEQRRGRAGRTQVGKCYRLYSKKNYESMNKISEPEILRVNLGQALLKLMKLGINDPLQFDFVQSPPKEVLCSTMQQLLDLNAVNLMDMSLTQLGEHMSCLPLEPRLSYMILTGIDFKIGFEAIVLASLVTVSRNIFFRSQENKSEADTKKMRFCQSESDFLTFFEVYKEWVMIPKQSKSKWCTINCINARSLRTVHDLINEIIHILQNEVNMKISMKFSEDSVRDIMLKLIFRSFYQNLCIFSGHYRFGYRSTNVSGDLLIHPSSALYTYGHWRPEFLVYDTILRTNQTYLINVSPVSKDMILDCMHTFGLNIDLTSLEALPLATYCISPIGKTVLLREIIGKHGIQRRQLENQLKNVIQSEYIIIDIDIQKGEVKICGPQDKYDEVAAVLHPLIERAQERLLKEEKEIYIYPELCTIISAGISVRDVVCPGEFRDLKVVLNAEIDIKSVVEKLQTCGQVCTVKEFKNYFKITFLSPLSAELALKTFPNEESFTLREIVNANVNVGRINQYKVFVSFLRRKCTGEAFITTDPIESAHFVELVSYHNYLLRCSVCKKTSDLRITGLPPDTDRHDFEKFANSRMPIGTKLVKCVVVREKALESSAADLYVMKQRLSQMFSEFTSKNKFSIDLKKPVSKNIMWNACIFFQNPCDGETAVNVLKNRKNIDGFCDLQLKPSLQTNLYCKQEVFTAVEEQIAEALKYFKDNAKADHVLEINAVRKGEGNVMIKITGNNTSDISDARRCILNFILGDQIECSGNAILEKLFSKMGQEYIKKISETKPKCYVELNKPKKTLTIFGDISVCNSLKMEINEFLDKLAEENLEEIILMPENGKPGVLRELLNKYGHDLEDLKVACSLASVEVNSRQHILTIGGSNASVDKCKEIISDIRMKLENLAFEEDAELCPVCYDKVSNQFHRLEYCGHAYCKECILHWFKNTNDLPLCCIECESSVVLEDIYWAAKEIKCFDTEMFKKALAAFVDMSINICTKCQELFHYGMSCGLYQLSKASKDDDDYSLKMWMEEDPEGRKICPSPNCSSPIEKNGGCNHMTCWKCKCHMCWLCLQVFPTADSVYDHQIFCPKLKKTTTSGDLLGLLD